METLVEPGLEETRIGPSVMAWVVVISGENFLNTYTCAPVANQQQGLIKVDC